MFKISFIQEQVSSIQELLDKKSKEEILTDSWLVKGLKYSLQTAIEAIIDLSYHIAVKKCGYAPIDARDAIRILVEREIISKENWPVYSAMIGFRNRIVHGYQSVSAVKVYEIAKNCLDDFNSFISEIKAII
jgi:uncharacterized protein YutE (UPF0331/DUF86 family)